MGRDPFGISKEGEVHTISYRSVFAPIKARRSGSHPRSFPPLKVKRGGMQTRINASSGSDIRTDTRDRNTRGRTTRGKDNRRADRLTRATGTRHLPE